MQNCVNINNKYVQIFQDVIKIIMNFWIYKSNKATNKKIKGFEKDDMEMRRIAAMDVKDLP